MVSEQGRLDRSSLRALVPLALMPEMLALRLVAPLAAAALLSSCNLTLPGTDCPADIGWEVRPSERTIRVGQSFTAEAFVITCGGRDKKRTAVMWRSSDPGVAQVDSLSGRVTGVAPGSVQVEAHDLPGQTGYWNPVRITVLP